MADIAENGIEENGDVEVPEIELIIRVSTKYWGNIGCDLGFKYLQPTFFTRENLYWYCVWVK